MEIDPRWVGSMPEAALDNAIRLVAILAMSNEAENAKDPFVRRLKLNELQAAIQAAKPDIEAIAEGLVTDPQG